MFYSISKLHGIFYRLRKRRLCEGTEGKANATKSCLLLEQMRCLISDETSINGTNSV